MKKSNLNYIIIFILITVTFGIVFKNNDIVNLYQLIFNIDKSYFLLAVLCMTGYWFIDGLIINKVSNVVNSKISILKSIKIAFIGQYYGLITPFSTGGQPAQIYKMVNNSISIGKATSIMINKYIMFQIGVTFYTVLMLVFKFAFILSNIKAIVPFIIIGVVLNVVMTVVLIGLFFNPMIIRKIALWMLNFVHKIKSLKKRDKYIIKIDYHLDEYLDSIERIKKSKMPFALVFIMTLLQLSLRFSIPYFIYLSFGLSSATFIDIVAIQSLLYMAICYMPTPGTVGVAEGGFYLAFKVFFNSNIIAYAMLLWRGIIYYLNLIVSGTVTLVDQMSSKKSEIAIEE